MFYAHVLNISGFYIGMDRCILVCGIVKFVARFRGFFRLNVVRHLGHIKGTLKLTGPRKGAIVASGRQKAGAHKHAWSLSTTQRGHLGNARRVPAVRERLVKFIK
jgi:hypothetical protein